MPKNDIILIVLKCCVSQMYLIVLLHNLKHMYDQINQIDQTDKKIIAIYRKLVLFLQ